ncbi:MAG: ribose 5-phosphate isomerase [Bacteroidota bacterium]
MANHFALINKKSKIIKNPFFSFFTFAKNIFMSTIIGIAADHAGFELKEKIKSYLTVKGFVIKDFGTHDTVSMDYPDVVHPLCKAIGNNEFEQGILICGSAQGVAITANKHSFIRAVICWNVEIATITRQHNNANIICLPARFIDEQSAKNCVDAFFATEFEGGRHQNRVNKISIC